MSDATPNIFVTLGDPLGIGPEVTLKALQHLKNTDAVFHVIGHPKHLQLVPHLQNVLSQKNVRFIEVTASLKGADLLDAGLLSIACLETALTHLKDPKRDALVTAPISKTHIQQAGFEFPGHTEFLCARFGVKKAAMMLFTPNLRVVLLTIHKPLREIFNDITVENLLEKLDLTVSCLKKNFHIAKPKIAVCGVNPHASENGLFGREERDVLQPGIEKFREMAIQKDCEIFGPCSADTVFYQALQNRFDAVICNYHDQALIPIKTIGFDLAVNTTLGLPFVRTSPDHGTAFDIAGRMMASEKSMMFALKSAIDFLGNGIHPQKNTKKDIL